jgi:hypothetical protein
VRIAPLILRDTDVDSDVAARIAIHRLIACIRRVRACLISGLAGYCKRRSTWTKTTLYNLRFPHSAMAMDDFPQTFSPRDKAKLRAKPLDRMNPGL